jgi:hypothetical protein
MDRGPVCESLIDFQTRKRGKMALGEAMLVFGLGTGTIAARNEAERIEVGDGTTFSMPSFRIATELCSF